MRGQGLANRPGLALFGAALVLPGVAFLALVAVEWPPVMSLISDPVLASVVVIACSIAGFMGIMIVVLGLVGRIHESAPFLVHDR